MSTFYAIDSTRVSHREYWWGTRSPAVLVGWILKWLRIRIPSSTDDPNVDSTLPFIVEALPPEVAIRFQPLTEDLARLGFLEPVYHVIRDAGTSTTIHWATFRHQSGQHFARIHQRLWQRTKTADRGTFLLLFSAFTDGTFVVSSSGKPDLDAPPQAFVQRLRDVTPTALWEAHLLAARHPEKAVQPIRTREELIASSERYHLLMRDFHLARGVFRQRSGAEQAQAERFASKVLEAQASGLEHAEVLAELDRLQVRKPGWGNAAIILLVSVVAFLAIGATQSWKITLWLIPVLLLHESGHWLAMKVFGYRNLRMFFIPLFGAAVTGQNWNVPGWKKGLVSLAGPLPGIILGVAFTLAGLITKQPWLNTAALLLLLINGFNLLPLLPLDGGHLLHATLFCRNRWLDITFRLAALGALLLLAFAGLGKFFVYIAVAMGISLPMAFKLSKVTDRLRRTPLPPPLLEEQGIPVPTAQAIISAIKAEMPRQTTNRTLAQLTLNVFETLNARPPGVWGTVGLLAVQGGSILLVVLCSFLLILDKHGGGLGSFAHAAVRQPQHPLDCGSHSRWSGDAAASLSAFNTTVATFQRHAQAKNGFEQLQGRLPATTTLSLVGETLFLTLPAEDDAARERWFKELQRLSTNVFVVLTNQAVSISLMFVAPHERAATNLEQELNDYFHVASLAEFVAPWSPAALKPGFEKTRQARRMWRHIDESIDGIWKDVDTKALSVQLSAATRRGAQAEVGRLSQERSRLRKDLESRTYSRLRTEGCPVELVDLQTQFHTLSFTNRTERAAVVRQLATHLGEVLRDEDGPQKSTHHYGATGYAIRHGLLLEIPWAAFKDAAIGFPALSDWLCQKGCLQMKYDVHPGSSLAGELDE